MTDTNTIRLNLSSYKVDFVDLSPEDLRSCRSSGNWRTDMDLRALAAQRGREIMEVGQETELFLWVDPEHPNVYTILRGHCRKEAGLWIIATHGVDAYLAATGGNGLRAKIFRNISRETAALLKADNANSASMREDTTFGAMDFYRMSSQLFTDGLDRQQVRALLNNKMEAIWPIKNMGKGKEIFAVRQSMKELQEKHDARCADASPEVVAALSEQFEEGLASLKAKEAELLDAYRKGLIDQALNYHNSGPWMAELLLYATYGEVSSTCPEGLKLDGMTFTPKGIVKDCGKAAREATGVARGVLTEVQRCTVHHNEAFLKVWKKYRKEADERLQKGKSDTKRRKALAGTAVLDIAKGYASDGLKNFCKMVAGEEGHARTEETREKVDERMAQVDLAVYMVEVLREEDPDFYRNEMLPRFERAKAAREAQKAAEASGSVDANAEEAPTPKKKKARKRSKKNS